YQLDEGAVTSAPTDEGAVTSAPTDEGAVTSAPTDEGVVTSAPTDEGAVTSAPTDEGAVTSAPTDEGVVTSAPTYPDTTIKPIDEAIGLVDPGVDIADSCVSQGNLYVDGESVPTVVPCQTECICHNGTVHCQQLSCPSPPQAFLQCSVVPSVDQCCPTYNCPETDGEASSCISTNGNWYKHGDYVPSDSECSDCFCSDGEIVCASLECVSPGPNCVALPAPAVEVPASSVTDVITPIGASATDSSGTGVTESTTSNITSSTTVYPSLSPTAETEDKEQDYVTEVTLTTEDPSGVSEDGDSEAPEGTDHYSTPSSMPTVDGTDSVITEASVATDGLDITEVPSVTVSSLYTEPVSTGDSLVTDASVSTDSTSDDEISTGSVTEPSGTTEKGETTQGATTESVTSVSVSESSTPEVTPSTTSPAVAPEEGVTTSPAVAPEEGVTTSPAVAPEEGVTTSPAVTPEEGVTTSPAVAPEEGVTTNQPDTLRRRTTSTA
ncbi:putative Titin-like 30, partial [Homarus americanus]